MAIGTRRWGPPLTPSPGGLNRTIYGTPLPTALGSGVPYVVPEIGYGAAAPEVPGAGAAAGRDAMEIHISSVPRAYLGSNLLVGEILLPEAITRPGWRARGRQWGAARGRPRKVPRRHRVRAAAPEVPPRPGAGTRGAAAAPEVPAPY